MQVVASYIVARLVLGVGEPVADAEHASLRDQMVDRSVPVENEEYVVCERSKEIRVVDESFGAIEKR